MQHIEHVIRKKEEKRMRWVLTSPLLQEGGDPDLREFMKGVEDDIRAMVGSHYYFIRCGVGSPALCRVPLFTKGKFPREVIDHARHGISDDDLYHAIGVADGNATAQGYYRISDHIEGKLRALFDA